MRQPKNQLILYSNGTSIVQKPRHESKFVVCSACVVCRLNFSHRRKAKTSQQIENGRKCTHKTSATKKQKEQTFYLLNTINDWLWPRVHRLHFFAFPHQLFSISFCLLSIQRCAAVKRRNDSLLLFVFLFGALARACKSRITLSKQTHCNCGNKLLSMFISIRCYSFASVSFVYRLPHFDSPKRRVFLIVWIWPFVSSSVGVVVVCRRAIICDFNLRFKCDNSIS